MAQFQKILLGSFLLLAAGSLAAETRLAVPMDYRLLRSVLVSQLYTAGNETSHLWQDGKDCSFLDISNPQISGEAGQIKIDNTVHARLGLQLAGKCIPALTWNGVLQTWQRPSLADSGNVLRFPITRTTALDNQGQPLNNAQLQELINKAVQQKLADLKIDLDQSRGDIVKTLLPFVDAADTETLQDTINSLRFNQVEAGDKTLTIGIGFIGQNPEKPASQPVPAFTANEMKQWRAVWHKLEQSLESGLSQSSPLNQSKENQATLQAVLQNASTAFDQGLTENIVNEEDPVRQFFDDSWDRLGSLLRKASTRFPGAEGLRYLTLIAATDAMYELDTFARPLGLEISSNGLRKLVRSYLQHQTEQKKASGGR